MPAKRESQQLPRYYFHISLGSAYIHDSVGIDLPNEAAARQRAIEDIIAVWQSSAIRKQNPAACAVVVAIGETTELFRVPFVEAPGVMPRT